MLQLIAKRPVLRKIDYWRCRRGTSLGIPAEKRDASLKVVELMLPLEVEKLQHPREKGPRPVGVGKCL
jgi:hypothetical protein